MRQKINLFFTPSPAGSELSTRQILTLVGLAGLAAFILATVPIINLLDYPFRLLITIIHELGHGVAALLTGGRFSHFTIAPDGSGLAYTGGGWRLAVIPAGYLGVALFAAALFRLGRNPRLSRLALGIIGAAMLVLSLWFGRPGAVSISAVVGSVLGMVMGVIFGAIFLKVALQTGSAAIIFFLHLVAIKAGFAAFDDIFTVIGLATQGGAVPHTDAHAMAEITHLPAVLWGLCWVVIAAMLIGGAIKATWFSNTPAEGRF